MTGYLCRNTRVGVQREARGVMTEHRGHGFYIHAVLQRHRCEGVA